MVVSEEGGVELTEVEHIKDRTASTTVMVLDDGTDCHMTEIHYT